MSISGDPRRGPGRREGRRGFEPRFVLTLLLVAIPLLWVIGSILLVRDTDECAPGVDHVGGFSQMFLPGVSCQERPATGR